jgi:tetratricopeptide (TPR) repeat protein
VFAQGCVRVPCLEEVNSGRTESLMDRFTRRGIPLALFLLSPLAYGQAAPPSSTGQSATQEMPAQPLANASYDEQKKFAVSLFNKQFNLEALPIFENLARQDPSDTDVLLGLGASLLAHSATINDESSARAERMRARKILLRAKELGSNNALLLNLLDTLPADGSLRYPGTPEVAKAIEQGEKAFASNDYQEAINNYTKAFELDPKSYSAALFIGDSYFAMKNAPKAAEWYDRAIQINPDAETAYRYESDMYTKNGDQEKARRLAIQAVVAEPYAQISWRGLAQWATSNKLKLTAVRINAQGGVGSDGGKTTITVNAATGGSAMAVWLVYSGVRINWQKEEFKKHYPQEAAYRHTLAEEVEALSTAASMLKDQKTEKLASDPDLATLKKLSDAKMLEPYVLLGAADRGIAVDYIAYRDQNRAKLEEYLSTYVVPPAPASSPAK